MKKIVFLLFAVISIHANAQYKDSLLLGEWVLFQIIDNQTGKEIAPEKPHKNFEFKIHFMEDSLVKFNLDINKCSDKYYLPAKNQIRFMYYAECTEICCDKDFSDLLTYDDCTSYYLKNSDLLVLVSEDRMYYFNRRKL